MRRTWHLTNSELETRDIPLSSVKSALDNLETTYILRAFVRFEALLREHLATRKVPVPYKTEDVINKAARKQYPRIPNNVRDQVHIVREYRNAIVHSKPVSVSLLGFQDTLSYLNQFLARVEDIP